MENTEKKHIDRRVVYTRNVIKDTFLSLLSKQPYEKLNVSAICKEAEVTRTTFYAHYESLNAVVDELVTDAFEVAKDSSSSLSLNVVQRLNYLIQFDTVEKMREHNSDLPPCQRIADDPKYRALFLDNTLSDYIKNKLYLMNKDSNVPVIMEYCHVSEEQAQQIFRYMLFGAYEVNSAQGWKKDDAWFAMRIKLLQFEAAGLDSIRKANESR